MNPETSVLNSSNVHHKVEMMSLFTKKELVAP